MIDFNKKLVTLMVAVLCDPDTDQWRVTLWASDERGMDPPVKHVAEFGDKRAALSWLAGRMDSQHELMTRPVVPIRFDAPSVPPEHHGEIRGSKDPVTDLVLPDGPITFKLAGVPVAVLTFDRKKEPIGTEDPQVSAVRAAHARFEGERPCPQCGAYGCKLA